MSHCSVHTCCKLITVHVVFLWSIYSIDLPARAKILFSLNFSFPYYMIANGEDRRNPPGFNCQCVACIKNYPNLSELPHGKIPFPEEVQFYPEFRSHRQIDRSIALNTNYGIAEYLQRYDNYQPCKELVIANASFIKILNELFCKEISITLKMFGSRLILTPETLRLLQSARLPPGSINIFVDSIQ